MYIDTGSRQRNAHDYKPLSNLSMAVNQTSMEHPYIYPNSLPQSYLQSPLSATLDPPDAQTQDHLADPLHHNSHNDQVEVDPDSVAMPRGKESPSQVHY